MVEKEKKEEEETKKITISVKGIRDDIYKNVSELAKHTGKTIGEITNDAYRTFLGTVEGVRNISQNFIEGAKGAIPRYIDNFKKLEITADDLKDLGQKVAFRNIEELTFRNISDEEFSKYVAFIDGVKVLRIPKTVKKTTVIKISTFVDEIIQE
ncbi:MULTISPECIES: hypothetical protein [unclassified Thermoplasma]|uniref:hypothetical protein n=1 Tax=unclassified Thermoplasma TaxID=2684908 RepID=UPI000D825856|nr:MULTISPECIES: hypothetical protein [unclassified Thermoplasma]PYB68808.1 hypothetical protein DMB44_02785 [Thermoplasma sp. Kam2015]